MTPEQITLLIELIDAKIAEYHARGSSDGGLSECLRVMKLTDQLRDTAEPDATTYSD